MSKVYIVMATRREYSDREEWPCFVLRDEERAKRLVVTLKQELEAWRVAAPIDDCGHAELPFAWAEGQDKSVWLNEDRVWGYDEVKFFYSSAEMMDD